MENWKNSLVCYFEKGIKQNGNLRLGVEIEHFILDAENRAVPYTGPKGVRQILTELIACYPEAKPLPDDDFFGFQTKDFSITIEPAAQFEISIAPMKTIRQIETIYREFSDRLSIVLSDFGYHAATVGCHPVSRVASLEIIPKRRYALMDARFGAFGTGGMEMMRGTASLQVSIDYLSEQDFRNKLQAAYFYGPLLKLFCDNAMSFQGESLRNRLKRTDIWRRTDPVRCGILPGVFSESYGFADYADFLGDMPPIFLKRGKDLFPTGSQTVSQLYADRAISDEEAAHVISMAFPDVRVKQFLELRFADSVPLPFALAYSALIKGLLYSENGLLYAQELIRSKKLTEDAISQAEDAIMRDGWHAEMYGMHVETLADTMLGIACRALPEEERPYLTPLYAVIRFDGIAGIPPEVCSSLLETDHPCRECTYGYTDRGI